MLDYLLVWNADQWEDVRGSVRTCSEVEQLRRPRILHPCRHLSRGWVGDGQGYQGTDFDTGTKLA